MKLKITIALSLLFHLNSKAQDPRITQYESIPLLISPANTGNFDGDLRATSSFSRLSANNLYNYFTNIGLEYKIGNSKSTALGISYSRSGSNKFSMSGDYFGLSASTFFHLDENKKSMLRLGIQASYISGSYQVSNDKYNNWLDVNSFLYSNNSTSTQDILKNSYLNFAFGFGYKYENDNIRFESNLGAYNVLNPKYDINKDNDKKLRVRYSFSNSFRYKFNQLNAIKFSQTSWQEGLYLNQSPNPANLPLDSLRINESIFGFNWERSGKTPYSLGVYSRSFKSASLIVGVNFAKNFTAKISYELPLNEKYYNVSQFGISLIAIK